MYHRIYFHVVWTTRDRERMITADVARFLENFLPAVASQERATLLALGAVRTHLHLMVRTEPTTELPRLLQRWKGGSSMLVGKEGVAERGALRWEKGYSIHSVSSSMLERAMEYVLKQPQHHPKDAIAGWEPRRYELYERLNESSAELRPISTDLDG